jgi:hypothetical protein
VTLPWVTGAVTLPAGAGVVTLLRGAGAVALGARASVRTRFIPSRMMFMGLSPGPPNTTSAAAQQYLHQSVSTAQLYDVYLQDGQCLGSFKEEHSMHSQSSAHFAAASFVAASFFKASPPPEERSAREGPAAHGESAGGEAQEELTLQDSPGSVLHRQEVIESQTS